jgi:hypothetical protein
MLRDTFPSGNDNPPTPDDLHGDSPDDFDVDAAFVAEMERRDAAAIITAGNVAIMDSLAATLERGAM